MGRHCAVEEHASRSCAGCALGKKTGADSALPHREDDKLWPKKNIVGKQELEVKIGDYHISFEVRSIPVPPRTGGSCEDEPS